MKSQSVKRPRPEIVDTVGMSIVKFGELFGEKFNRDVLEPERKGRNFISIEFTAFSHLYGRRFLSSGYPVYFVFIYCLCIIKHNL